MSLHRWLGLLLALFALSAAPLRAGVLDDVRSEVRHEDPADHEDEDHDYHHDHDDYHHHHGDHGHSHCHDDDDDSILGNLLGAFCVYSVVPHGGEFARYPYADDVTGYYLSDEDAALFPSRFFSGNVAFEYGDDFDSLGRYSGEGMLELGGWFGVDTQWDHYRERLPGGSDNLTIGDVNFLFHLIDTPCSSWRWGIGANFLDDAVGSDSGLNLTLRMQAFPVRPLVVSGEVDAGWIGSADTFHGNLSIGVIHKHWEVYAGYDYREIGNIELAGPMFGLRCWF